jgi:hypothetical protein
MTTTTDPAEVLTDPLAAELLASPMPARLAYVAQDGTPRVVPIAFLHDPESQRITVCTAPEAPKVAALRANPNVAITLDTDHAPWHALLLRGTVDVEVVEGVPEEYLAASRKGGSGEGSAEFEAAVRQMYEAMARIRITPTWAKVLDFEGRLPDFLQRRYEERMGGG